MSAIHDFNLGLILLFIRCSGVSVADMMLLVVSLEDGVRGQIVTIIMIIVINIVIIIIIIITIIIIMIISTTVMIS